MIKSIGSGMKVSVENNCTGCGMCIESCPEVFYMGSKAAAISGDIPPEFEQDAQQAAIDCPVEAIIIE